MKFATEKGGKAPRVLRPAICRQAAKDGKCLLPWFLDLSGRSAPR